VGFGTGDDLLELASIVGPTGRAVGVDTSEQFVSRLRAREQPGVEARVADARSLPFGEGEFDAVRADRVLQHVGDPGRAVVEMLRVLRPGGRIYLGDTDWGGLMVDAGAATASGDRVRDHICDGTITSGRVGRQLFRLLTEAGGAGVRAQVIAYPVRQLELAEALFSLSKKRRARRGGRKAALASSAWSLDRSSCCSRCAAPLRGRAWVGAGLPACPGRPCMPAGWQQECIPRARDRVFWQPAAAR
jgi:SAM-dependent methyltransferase